MQVQTFKAVMLKACVILAVYAGATGCLLARVNGAVPAKTAATEIPFAPAKHRVGANQGSPAIWVDRATRSDPDPVPTRFRHEP